jgi:cytochrome b subunit of formate dehydrogenase
MPSSDQILAGLKEIKIHGRWLHNVFYFTIIIAGLITGVRLLKRDFEYCWSLRPVVSIIAWLLNPFNGIVFALLGVLLIYISLKFRLNRLISHPHGH